MFTFIYIYIYICVCIYMCVCVCVYVCVCVFVVQHYNRQAPRKRRRRSALTFSRMVSVPWWRLVRMRAASPAASVHAACLHAVVETRSAAMFVRIHGRPTLMQRSSAPRPARPAHEAIRKSEPRRRARAWRISAARRTVAV